MTTIGAGASATLSQAVVQRVAIAGNGAAATVLFPSSPQNNDGIYVHQTGSTFSNAATVNPNGNSIEDPQHPGTITTNSVLMGASPGSSALWVYELGITTWRLWN